MNLQTRSHKLPPLFFATANVLPVGCASVCLGCGLSFATAFASLKDRTVKNVCSFSCPRETIPSQGLNRHTIGRGAETLLNWNKCLTPVLQPIWLRLCRWCVWEEKFLHNTQQHAVIRSSVIFSSPLTM